MHGFLTGATAWKVIEAKADAKSAWVTTKLEFFRIPQYMTQFPFAHTLTMTYRVQDGALEVRDADRQPERGADAGRDRVPSIFPADGLQSRGLAFVGRRQDALAARRADLADGRDRADHQHPAGPEERRGEGRHARRHLHGPRARRARARDDEPEGQDASRWTSSSGRSSRRSSCCRVSAVAVVAGRAAVRRRLEPVLLLPETPGAAAAAPATPQNAGDGRGAPPNPNAPPARGSVAFEPMAGISNSMNLAQKGLYKELQTIEPGGSWEESFWVRPKGY